MAAEEAIWLLGLVFFMGICLGKLSRGMQPLGSSGAAVLFAASLLLYWLDHIYVSRIVALLGLAVYGVTRYAHAKWQRAQAQKNSK